MDVAELQGKVNELLARVPQEQRQAAAALVGQYGPRLFEMAKEDAWQYLRRLMAGDMDAVSELDARLSDDQWIARVKANTARWENVAAYNVIRDRLRNEMLLKMAPIVVGILAALVGL